MPGQCPAGSAPRRVPRTVPGWRRARRPAGIPPQAHVPDLRARGAGQVASGRRGRDGADPVVRLERGRARVRDQGPRGCERLGVVVMLDGRGRLADAADADGHGAIGPRTKGEPGPRRLQPPLASEILARRGSFFRHGSQDEYPAGEPGRGLTPRPPPSPRMVLLLQVPPALSMSVCQAGLCGHCPGLAPGARNASSLGPIISGQRMPARAWCVRLAG